MQGVLTFTSHGQAHLLRLPRTRFIIGSDPGSGLSLAGSGVPAYCCSLTWDAAAGTWVLETEPSARGLVRVDGNIPVKQRQPLHDAAHLDVGGFAARFDLLPDPPVWGGNAVREVRLESSPVRLGRANDEADARKIVLDPEDTRISRLHCVLEQGADGRWMATDKSNHGSWLNGRLFETERLTLGDRLRIGRYSFEFSGRSLRRLPGASGGRVEAENLTREAGGRRILETVSMDVPAGSFTGILGGSGQGKSTLMSALCGLQPASSGRVLIDGVPAQSAEEATAGARIGYVPQDDIVHTELTVLQAITCSARLRLRSAPPRAEINAGVLGIIRRLGLEPHMHTRISRLSGGQRKRVSIATELLSKPSVLFLDEPSSGLDPATEFHLMSLLRELAGSDCTVLCTTHVLGRAYLFDRIAFVAAGRLIWFGSPSDALQFFGKDTLDDVYLELEKPERTPAQWEETYQASPLRPVPAPAIPVVHDRGAAPPAKRPGWWSTLRTLLRRQWMILKADPLNLAFLLAQAVLIALLIGWVAPSGGMRAFLSVVAVLWFGCSNAAQQIVGERAILKRERVCGLGLHPYLQSKLGFIFGITSIQTVLLFATVTATAAMFHPADFNREELLQEDERFTGPVRTAENGADAEPVGAGARTLTRLFDFSKADALELASRFRLSPEGKDIEGNPNVDDTAIVLGAEKLAGTLRAEGVDLQSDAARARVGKELATPPPGPAPPSEFYRDTMLTLIRWFGLQENVRDSRAWPMTGADGNPLLDPITGSVRKHDAQPLWRVVFIPVLLYLAALLAAGLTGTALGLAISALVRNPTQAVLWVPLILIPQILFGGFVITRPEMAKTVRHVSTYVPSAAAQRLLETGSVYGLRVPRTANATRIPVFFDGKPDRVTWVEDGSETSQEYVRTSPANTALQNLIVDPNLIGQRKVVLSGEIEAQEVDSRRDTEPWSHGVLVTMTRPAWDAAGVLGAWIVLCYVTAWWKLRRSTPG